MGLETRSAARKWPLGYTAFLSPERVVTGRLPRRMVKGPGLTAPRKAHPMTTDVIVDDDTRAEAFDLRAVVLRVRDAHPRIADPT